MCACDEGAICSRCRPVDYFDASHDRDDPYNDQPSQESPAEFVTAALAVSGNQPQ